MANFKPHMDLLPVSIQSLIRHVVHVMAPSEVILFGSRARGTHRENSDFDLAVKGPINRQDWTKMQVEMEDMTMSLYPVDLVLYEELGDDYKKNIQAEGKIIYG